MYLNELGLGKSRKISRILSRISPDFKNAKKLPTIHKKLGRSSVVNLCLLRETARDSILGTYISSSYDPDISVAM